MRKFILMWMVIASIGVTGCRKLSQMMLMDIVDPTTINTSISEDESAIVFFRPKGSLLTRLTRFNSAFEFVSPIRVQIEARVLEKIEGNSKTIAWLFYDAKHFYKTTPGKHIFFTPESFMVAELEGGKIYYVCILQKMGVFNPQFYFMPIKPSELSSDEFKADYSGCETWYENTQYAQESYKKESNRVKLEEYLDKKYSTRKPEDDIVMSPEYGTDTVLQ